MSGPHRKWWRLAACLGAAVALLAGWPCAFAQQLAARQVEVSATGANELDAMAQALASAVQQVKGLRVNGLTAMAVRESMKDNRVGTSSELLRLSASVTQGAVKSYEVLESAGTPGAWRVRIRANVATYAGGEQLKRLRLAVAAPRLAAGLQKNAAARKLAAEFAEQLEGLLTQTRRFAMLDRQFTQAVDAELANYKSESFSPEETARIGKKAGVDYLVVGQLGRYEVVDHSIRMEMTGKVIPRKSARAAMQLRLIDVATGQIKYAHTFDTGEQTARSSGAAQGLLGGMAERAAADIVAAIYPLAIVAADAATVTLGQGGETVKAGQRFQVYALGEPMKDPYTGESLGRREVPIGVIEVVSVAERVSTARILDGASAITARAGKDMIVRAAAPGVPQAAANAVGRKPAGGKVPKPDTVPGAAKRDDDW